MSMATSAAAPDKPHEHADGIYFGLDEIAYREDPAVGSTDMKSLAFAPCDYWYGSFMNPDRPARKETDATLTGTAIHVLAFHGEGEFDKRYMRGPEQHDDMSPGEKGTATKKYKEIARAKGLTMLSADAYDRIAIVCAKVMKNPRLARAFTGGAPEVSVFWTEQHGKPGMAVRKKGRVDYLKARGIGDLKSVENMHELPFPRACINHITNYNYHIQAKHYMDARARMPELIADGCVHGDHDPALVKALATNERYGWQWVFWQKSRAPITWSRILSPGNPIFDIAARSIERGVRNYVDYMQRFGPHQMWLEDEEPGELYVEDLPPYFARD